MKQATEHDLYRALIQIEQEINHKWPLIGNKFRASNIAKREFVDKALHVVDILNTAPYLSAHAVSDQTMFNKHYLAVIYKMIQRSDVCQDLFRHSSNRDYFNVVAHYFNNNLYTLVFFVGTNCPSRCVYCPSVKIDSLGRRRLVKYKQNDALLLTNDTLDFVFDDLLKIKKKNTDIMVKISGGLEPLTDIKTMKAIISRCRKLGLPVKLFTNGLLLKDIERRKAALTTNDVRISLSTSDEDKYEAICFSSHKKKSKKKALVQLKESIQAMIRERDRINPGCKIGFNCIILPDNHRHIVSLLEMARYLGIDYVDFKPDYFTTHDESTQKAMDDSICEAKIIAAHESYKDIYVNFTGSLSRDNLYWAPWQGTCDTIKQSQYKMFITPYGQCSPVHYGAFPHSDSSFSQSLNCYTMGAINPQNGLLNILNYPRQTPEIDIKKLNPFELMLSLEISREEKDETWGLPLSVSPYRTQERNKVPADLFYQFDM